MSTLSSPTLGKLLTNVRNFLNQPNPQNSFWTDAELSDYLNKGVQRYFAEVVMHREGQFTATTTLDIVSGTETVALPSDFFEVRSLYITRSGGWEILPYRNNITDGFYTTGSSGAEQFRPYYFFRGNSLVLRPTPNFSATACLKLEYIQFPDTMVNGGDSLTTQVAPVFQELIEMYAIYKAKLKESMVNGVSMQSGPAENLAAVYQQFKDSIDKRSDYPEYIVPFNPESTW
jgi:hypothetical protein